MTVVKVRQPKKTKIINKLILIGNGFDLALGLKTSYSDFLFWLIKKQILLAIDSKEDFAPFPVYKGRYDEFLSQYYKKEVSGYSSNNLFDILLNRRLLCKTEDFENLHDVNSLLQYLKSKKIELNIKNSQGLFSMILNDSKIGWVDVENTYFKLLKDSIKKINKSGFSDYIDTLNSDLKHLINELVLYLKSLDTSIERNQAQSYLKQFNSKIDRDNYLDKDDFNIKTEINYYLNFNYTDTIKKVLKYSNTKYDINYIHGKINDESSNIIFGFGDEMDIVYKQLEELNDNRFFKFIKSFQYFKNQNYRNLLRFLNSNEYQVCIYGHSCGLSDRVMLNEIFEHKNCTSIKIYSYKDTNGKTDFLNKTMEISRHFNSNKEMRTKIINENSLDFIPQVSIETS